jgi:hypothetical protein
MKAQALQNLVEGIASALEAGATRSDVERILTHPPALAELLHAAQHVASGAEADTTQLRAIVFGLPAHGGVGLGLEEE